LIAAFGTYRDRYQTAHEVQCYSGIAPVIESSGKQHWIHFRWACPKFLRQTFHEWALHSMSTSVWARNYYEQQRAKNKSHHAAVRALAFKWIRILFRCWQDRQLYNEAWYEQARQRRAHTSTSLVDIAWKKGAGFSKVSNSTT
jgi:Transposase IS116/IS110/IS902 family